MDIALVHNRLMDELTKLYQQFSATYELSQAMARTIFLADGNPLLAEELAVLVERKARKEWSIHPPPQNLFGLPLTLFPCGLPL